MRKHAIALISLGIALVWSLSLSGQNCGSMNIQFRTDIASDCQHMTMTMIHDEQGRPYLYVANKEAGLKIYNITNVDSPKLEATVPVSSFNSLHVMNLSQSGTYLYLAIGNNFSNNQHSGMAIVDVTNPASATVTDFWELSSNGGAGIVKTEGNYAYLGAMGNGLVILDITDKANIAYVSTYVPDINYPTANPNPALYNARGMAVKNNIVYLCYDAGGLRIINTTNKSKPAETGRYSNPQLNGKPRAYNNIILDDTLVYIAADYCGMEVLDISDTAHITLHGWWNPYDCANGNWFTSPVHANEIQYDKTCHTVFMSTGKSDMYVLNVANPAMPDSCNMYGGVSNNIGTWGLGLYQDQIYLSYICTVGIPFASNWTGVKVLTCNRCDEAGMVTFQNNPLSVFPNPAQQDITVRIPDNVNKPEVCITDMYGRLLKIPVVPIATDRVSVNMSALPEGIYYIMVIAGGNRYIQKVIKQP